MDEAACRGLDPRIFYPETPDGRDDYSDEAVAYARSICATCPIRLECLAQGRDEKLGVWAGTTPQQRKELP